MHNVRQGYPKKIQNINTEKVLGKNLPANIEAEKAVLGAVLLNDETLIQVVELLAPDDFYHPPHKLIYQAIVDVSKRYEHIDIISLQDELTKKELLEQAGGITYLLELQEDIPAVGLIGQHAQIIKEKTLLRDLINSAASIISNCYGQDDKGIELILDHAEKTIFQISKERTAQSFVQLNIWLKKTFQHLSDIKSHGKGVTGIPSSFTKLDMMTSGFQNSDLVVLASRPSVGKTALALSFALNAAIEGYTVGFFSLEMAAEQLTLRLLSTESRIAHHNIRNATITSDEWMELTSVAARLAELPLFIDDTAILSIMDLRTKARKIKAEHNLAFLVIDYLQLIHSTKHHENRHQEISEISRSLKALAKELNIPILALSQLSRAVDSRMDKRPMLSDLRESGAIEQDADLIIFLYRDVIYNPDTENPSLTELIIGKQRNGPTGKLYLNFIKEITQFEESDD
ncbi:replicative DNA helicase [Candidatus Dependentiae bacterium]|nr:MAG: replicative DNA helicase [Candidatus Dependentiae bacterium]